MNEATAGKTPVHLWIVGVVSLLWHLGGAYDYMMSKMENMDYLSMMSDDPAQVQAVIDYMNGFPLWANIAWGLGVWGALAGSILLLLRSRHAVTAYLLSLVGMIGGVVHMMMSDNVPAVMSEGAAGYMMYAIVIVGIGLFLYARSMSAKGVLK